jgi:hypothetical protein
MSRKGDPSRPVVRVVCLPAGLRQHRDQSYLFPILVYHLLQPSSLDLRGIHPYRSRNNPVQAQLKNGMILVQVSIKTFLSFISLWLTHVESVRKLDSLRVHVHLTCEPSFRQESVHEGFSFDYDTGTLHRVYS